MTPETPIVFSLPGDADESMCPFHLATYLVEQHNDFVQRVDQALLMRLQDLQRHNTRINEVRARSVLSYFTPLPTCIAAKITLSRTVVCCCFFGGILG
jgi:hypothetical protein